ncbi:MAG: glycoside hydrolase family 2 protein [Planctomycetota bacterium]
MQILKLPEQWTLQTVGDAPQAPDSVRGRAVPATVPGGVHTDLLAAELIPDPYLDRHEQDVQWIGHTDWQYRCVFHADAELLAHDRVELVCDGLDTFATLELNGRPLGQAQNMHVRHRFDAKGLLEPGENRLTVTFAAALPIALERAAEHPELPVMGSGSNPQYPHHMIRKMACNFGWDWGPVLATAGIWRPIRFEAWSTARLTDLRPAVTLPAPDRAEVELRVDVQTFKANADPSLTLHATLTSPDGEHTGSARASAGQPLHLAVDQPQLWWPVGHGEQPLYRVCVELRDAQGQTLDSREHPLGLRTTELLTDPDPAAPDGPVDGLNPGAGMTLLVNGQPVYCKGANWIPDDCFPHRVTPERYGERLGQARDANMNMIRVWAGGLYEDDAFYEHCARMGLLVWQDFLFACATYPENDPAFVQQVDHEIRDNIARLARHTALVLWNGNNENFMLFGPDTPHWDERWEDQYQDHVPGSRFYHQSIPQALRELDPARPYWPGSPYSGSADLRERPANANEYGNRHIWDVWHGPGEYRNYLGHTPRFASEFGFHGPPNWPNLAASVPPDQWSWNSDCMNHHNKNSSDTPGQLQTHTRMADDFIPPTGDDAASFDDWLYLAQIGQARALDMGVSWFRALAPYCSGALYWQLNDCWPVSSWSAIDSDGGRKPLYFATRRFFAPRLLTLKPRRVTPAGQPVGPLALYAHNDSGQPWVGPVRLRRLGLDGETLHQTTVDLDLDPRQSARFPVPEAWQEDAEQTFIVADPPAPSPDETRAFWWFAPDKQLRYPEPQFDATLETHGQALRLRIDARSLIRDLCVFADRLDPQAKISDQAVTLLPGESFTFTVETAEPMTLEQLTAPPVMQSANRFGLA